ncbi:MAG: hypothetical protein RL595_52 [Planctomycetota bacterium]
MRKPKYPKVAGQSESWVILPSDMCGCSVPMNDEIILRKNSIGIHVVTGVG